MNCREAQDQIFAERDGALDATQRAALAAHVAGCPDCRRVSSEVAAGFEAWRTLARNVTVPDSEREWHAIRRQIRGGVAAGEVRLTPSRPGWLTWLVAPLAAAAALALALVISLPSGDRPASPATSPDLVARADSVQVGGRNSSTMVYVDERSGWLIVMASDAPLKSG